MDSVSNLHQVILTPKNAKILRGPFHKLFNHNSLFKQGFKILSTRLKIK
jgi:hypothetical protein